MGTRLYPLPGGDGDVTKVWYSLGLGMGMGMNFFCGDGYEITKPIPAPPRPVVIPRVNSLSEASSNITLPLWRRGIGIQAPSQIVHKSWLFGRLRGILSMFFFIFAIPWRTILVIVWVTLPCPFISFELRFNFDGKV